MYLSFFSLGFVNADRRNVFSFKKYGVAFLSDGCLGSVNSI